MSFSVPNVAIVMEAEPASNVAILSAFVDLSVEKKDLHGIWIPAVYWASLVSQKLGEEVEPPSCWFTAL
jgi:hypothetical protein